MTTDNQYNCPSCGADVEAPGTESEEVRFCPKCRLPQVLVAGKYLVEKELMEGGCGMLYLARHIRLQMDPVRVIKFIKHEYCQDEMLVKRLGREVEVTAALSQRNEHIVRVYDDFGEFATLGHYFVMEFLKGEELQDLLESQHVLTLEEAIHIFRQLCLAMRDAHKEGVIHRDLKPQNLFIVPRGDDPFFMKVIDFGIAKTLSTEQATALTQGIIGTPEYMAPEQCSGRPVDDRTDIYAMATILYRMIVGHTPFLPPDKVGTVSVMEMAVAQMMQQAIPPSVARPDLEIPPRLEQFILKNLSKKPKDRHPNVSEMLLELNLIAAEISGQSRSHTINFPESSTPPPSSRTMENHTLTPTPGELPAGVLLGQSASDTALMATGVFVEEPSGRPVGVASQSMASVSNPALQNTSIEDPSSASGLSSNRIVLVVVLALLMLGGGSFGVWSLFGEHSKANVPQRTRPLVPRRLRVVPKSRVLPRKLPTPRRVVVPVERTAPIRVVKRRKPRRRRTRRRKRRRVAMIRPVPKPGSTPGCPDGKDWVRFDLRPASARLMTSLKKSRYYSSWVCLQRQGRGLIRVNVSGYYGCFFSLPSSGKRFKIRLKRSSSHTQLEPAPRYCLKR